MSERKHNNLPTVTGHHAMAWKELAEADDLASSLTVDAFLKFTTHKMTDTPVKIPERIRTRLREILIDFKKHKSYANAYDQLTSDQNIVKKTWRTDPRFREHVYRYLLLFDDRSGVEIRPCSRYASEDHVGAAIFATKDWPKGSRINTLVGCIAELNHEEEVAFLKHRKNDFSVMYSSRKNCSQLWLGPAAYVNHDCQPNCEFTINCDADARMSLESKTDIHKGDEIFIYYGQHFFDLYNSACECFTCELLGRGFFSKFMVGPQSNSSENPENQESKADCNQSSQVRNNCSVGSGGMNSVECYENSALSLPHSPNGTLLKGSSAGLARLAMPTSYALRHTGSRLNRVKARIRAVITASDAKGVTLNQPASERLAAVAKPGKLTRSKVNSSEFVNIRSPRTSPMRVVPRFADLFEHNATDLAGEEPTSPVPPHLDRVSSMDSMSMPSQLSTAANTPDSVVSHFPHSCFTRSHVDLDLMPQLRSDSEGSSNRCSCYGSRTSDDSSSTSPARSVEPILGRLLDESRSARGSDSLSPLKPITDTKRLTNYDARLIAEANLLPPGTVRRRRLVPSVWGNVNTKRCKLSPKGHRENQCNPSVSLTAQRVVRRRRTLDPKRDVSSTTYDHSISHQVVCAESDDMCTTQSGEDETEPPVLTVMYTESSALNVSTLSNTDDENETASHGTSSTTPLRWGSNDSTSALSPLSLSDETEPNFERLNPVLFSHIHNDHDYTKRSGTPRTSSRLCNLTNSYNSNNQLSDFRSQDGNGFCSSSASRTHPPCTPPPPTLRPITPPSTLDRPIPLLFPNLDNIPISCLPNTPVILTSPAAPIPPSHTSIASPTACALTDLWPPVTHFDERQTTNLNRPLTVKLKRIGPKLYQITKPNRLLTFR